MENYGVDAELLIDFPDIYFDWACNIACSGQPGELYFFAKHTWGIGGRMHIYHTTDYFQTYTLYEHLMPVQGVDDPQISIVPSTINLNIWPNPTNAAFNIAYELNAMQDVRLTMYDILGRQVWQNNIGVQSPGNYRLSFTDDHFPSGQYFLLLQSQQGQIAKTITIIK